MRLDADPANANASGTWITVSGVPSEHFGSASKTRSLHGAPASLPETPPTPAFVAPAHGGQQQDAGGFAGRCLTLVTQVPALADRVCAVARIGVRRPVVGRAVAPVAGSHDERAGVSLAICGSEAAVTVATGNLCFGSFWSDSVHVQTWARVTAGSRRQLEKGCVTFLPVSRQGCGTLATASG